jgi:uncharacterized small protein (DUF1192 family)
VRVMRHHQNGSSLPVVGEAQPPPVTKRVSAGLGLVAAGLALAGVFVAWGIAWNKLATTEDVERKVAHASAASSQIDMRVHVIEKRIAALDTDIEWLKAAVDALVRDRRLPVPPPPK